MRSACARPKRVELPGLRRRDRLERGVERAGLEAHLRGIEGSLRAQRPVRRQLDRPLQERRGRADAATSLRPGRRPLELGGDLLVGPLRSRGHGARHGDPGRARRRWLRPGRHGRDGDPPGRRCGRRRNGRAGARTRPACRRRSSPRRSPGPARPSRRRGSHRHGARGSGRRGAPPPPRGRAAGSVAGARRGAARTSARSCRRRRLPGTPNPPASAATFATRPNSSRASGLPWLSLMTCSKTAASSGPGMRRRSSERASPSRKAGDRQLRRARRTRDRRCRCVRHRRPRCARRADVGRRSRGSARTPGRATARHR